MRKIFIVAATTFAASCLATVSAVSAASISNPSDQSTFERRGADDPKGHIRGEGVGHPLKADAPFTVARRGAGEPGDIRGEGAGHPVKADAPFTVARRGRGADDPKGHIRGEGVGHPLKVETMNSIV